MAVEASDREQAASITLADVARAHTEAGLEFPSGSNASRLVDMLSVFVPRAQGDPADPMSFTPLFLRAMAKRQQPPVDLAAGAYPAQRLRLSGLEVALLGAYVERVVRAGLPGAPQAPIVEPPCQGLAKLLDVLVPTADTLPGEKLPTSVERLEELLRNLEYRRDVDHARKLLATWKRMVTAIDAAQLMTMTHGHLKIETEPSGEVHKPFDPHTAPIRFRATVGLSEQEWQEYLTAVGGGAGPAAGIEELRDRKSLRDCATHVGLQLPKSITEVGEALADAKIRWTPKPSHDDLVQTERGSPPAAWQNPSTPDGTLMYPVTMESPVRAAGTFVLDTQTEAKPDHGSCAPGGCASGRSLCGRR